MTVTCNIATVVGNAHLDAHPRNLHFPHCFIGLRDRNAVLDGVS